MLVQQCHTSPMHVDVISVAPVKSLGLNHPESVDVTSDGVPGDRRFALIDEQGRHFSGKRCGALVQVRASHDDAAERLTLAFPDGTKVSEPVMLGGPVDAVFYGELRPAHLVLGVFAHALSRFADADVRLIRVPDGGGVDRRETGVVSMQSTASLAAIGRESGAEGVVDGRRFRMTFTIGRADEHAEDAWIGRRVRVGTAVIVPEGHTGRCAVTTQHPDTGVPDLDVLKAIAAYRSDIVTTGERLPFGVHARVVVPGRVSVGDAVVLDDGPQGSTAG